MQIIVLEGSNIFKYKVNTTFQLKTFQFFCRIVCDFQKELPNCYVDSATLAEFTKTDLQNCFCRIHKNRFAKLFLPNRHECLKVFVFVKNSGLNPRLQNGAMIRWHGWKASRNAFRFGSIPSTIHEHVSRLQKLEKENKEVLCHPLPSLTSPAIPYSSFELHLTMEPSPAKKPKQDLCQLSTDDWDVLRKLMGYYFCKVSTTFPPQKWNPRRRKSNRTWDIWHRKTLKPSVKWCLVGKNIWNVNFVIFVIFF